MSNLLKIGSFNISIYYLDNYKKLSINVIIICLIAFLFSCEASEKAEKQRLDMTYKTVSIIPSSQEESEFFETSYDKQPSPQYPW
jgi:hypothetical protein